MKFFKTATTFIAVNILIFGCLLFVRWPWIAEDFLIQDDLIFVPRVMFGQSQSIITTTLQWFIFNNAFVYFEDIAKVRTLYLLFFSISVSSLYFMLRRLINDNTYSLLILLVASLFPVFVDQAIFLSGSHPLLGLTFILFAIISIFRLLLSENRKDIFRWTLLAVSLFVASIFCSPTSLIVSLATLILLFYPALPDHLFFKRMMLTVSAFVPLLLKWLYMTFTGSNSYHYSRMEGWTIVTIDNIVTQLKGSVQLIQKTIGSHTLIAIVIILTLSCLIRFYPFLLTYKKIKPITNQKKTIIISLFFFVLSGLYFGPISVLTNISSRYLVGPSFFLVLTIGMFFYFLFWDHKYTRILLLVSFTSLCLLFTFKTKEIAENQFSRSVEVQSKIRFFVKEKAAGWKPDAQVVFILNKMAPHFTAGFNHWSTWYLRYLTKRSDIIGLVGHRSWLEENPIIQQYRDHGKEFWTTKETSRGRKLIRKKMIGIEEGRPTYIYVEQQDGSFVQYNQLLVFEKNEYQLYLADEYGLVLQSRSVFNFREFCYELRGKGDTTISFGQFSRNAFNVENVQFDDSTVVYDGNTFSKLKIPEGEYVDITIDISSSESPPPDSKIYSSYTDISPPMPFLWGRIGIYQNGINNYKIGKTNIVEENNRALINVKVVNKCGYMVISSGGQGSVMLGNYYSNAPVLIGRGFKNRYWKGSLNGIAVEVENDKGQLFYLNITDTVDFTANDEVVAK